MNDRCAKTGAGLTLRPREWFVDAPGSVLDSVVAATISLREK